MWLWPVGWRRFACLEGPIMFELVRGFVRNTLNSHAIGGWGGERGAVL